MVDVKAMKRNYSRDSVWIVVKFIFSNRVIDSWNSLSAQCINSCTINT